MGEMHARLPSRSQRITYSDLKSIAEVIEDGLSRGRHDGRRQSHVVGPAGATSASQEASRRCFGEGQVEEIGVMSQSTSQLDDSKGRVLEFVRKVGSSGWIRTSNPPVNSVTQVVGLAGSSCR